MEYSRIALLTIAVGVVWKCSLPQNQSVGVWMATSGSGVMGGGGTEPSGSASFSNVTGLLQRPSDHSLNVN